MGAMERTHLAMYCRDRSPVRILLFACALACASSPAAGQPGAPQASREGGQVVAQGPPAAGLAAALQSPLMGGVPAGEVTPGALRLSLHDAVQRGLERNLGAMLGRDRVQSADGARWMSMSGLLPTLYASIAQARDQINLEAYGFPVAPGTSPIIGPFNISDRRISVAQTVFDYSAIQDARAGAATKTAAVYAYQDVREQVVVVVANLYFQIVATASRVEAVRAQQRTAEALFARARAMKDAGTVAGIEVIRAQVQVENQKQRVIYYENEFAKQKLMLARAIGVPLAQAFELTDQVPFKAYDTMPIEEALAQAYARRADYKAALELLKADEARRRSAYGSMAPSVHFTADYGDIGPSWSSALGTYSVMGSVTVPLFQAGRERGRVLLADAALRQNQAQVADLKARIEYEVRAAYLDLKAAHERVNVARGAADLANQQMVQAQDRFAAGVASHVEVVQAQEAVATESENLIASLFAHNQAKAALARATGMAEDAAERLVGGQE
jgi:outer membrane protein TolC